MRKVIGIIMIILLFGGAVCGLIFGIKWKYANDTISSMYSKDEVEQIKEDIQNEWSDEKKGFLEKIENYESQIEDLSVKNEENLKQIENLTAVKTENENKIAELNEIIESNTEVINLNNEKISALNSEIERLLASESSNKSQISKLTSQVNTLQGLVEQLQITNELNSQTINLLNIQNKNLSAQINELLYQNQNHDLIVEQLNKKIDELEKSLEYYETYLDSLEDENQVVVTFEFDGSVYNVQVVEKGSKISVTTPSSTDYVIFNNWTVNGEQIDLSTYDFNQSTTVVADVTYKYDVKFMVDDEEYDSEIVTENGHATLPEAPTKPGYEFDGWTINGNTVVDVASTSITSNTTFHAKFTKLHTVTFKYEEGIKSTQQVRDGEYATDVEIESTTYKIFNGWKVNNNIVDVEDYVIISDTEFVADVTYKYDVKFMVDDEEYDSQIVVENGFASLPEDPVKEGYKFAGWSFDKYNPVDTSTNPVTDTVTYHACFIDKHAGVWEGYFPATEYSEPCFIRFEVLDSGIWLCTTEFHDGYDRFTMSYQDVDQNYFDHDGLVGRTGYDSYEINWINEDVMTATWAKFTATLSRIEDRVDGQKILVDYNKQYSENGETKNISFDGYNLTVDSTQYNYYFISDTEFVCYQVWGLLGLQTVKTGVLTDTYLQIEDTTYTFI